MHIIDVPIDFGATGRLERTFVDAALEECPPFSYLDIGTIDFRADGLPCFW